MRLIFILLFITSFIVSKAQHYAVGVPVDTTLSTTVNAPLYHPFCSQTDQINIYLDTSLYTYVDGLQFMMIFDSITGYGGLYGGPNGQIHNGDTIILNASNPGVHSTFLTGCYYSSRLKIVGTPTNAGQAYPCELAFNICTCYCPDIAIVPSRINSSTCTVDLANSVGELKLKDLSVFPNPVTNQLSVTGISSKTILSLYDAYGKRILEKETDRDTSIDLSYLAEGVYTLFKNDGKTKTSGKVIVTR